MNSIWRIVDKLFVKRIKEFLINNKIIRISWLYGIIINNEAINDWKGPYKDHLYLNWYSKNDSINLETYLNIFKSLDF